MSVKKVGLGRGLNALINSHIAGQGQQEEQSSANNSSRESLQTLPIDSLQSGRYQPRSHFDEAALLELSQSIKTQGIIQPIVVRPLPQNRYEIIAGERRWRAAKIAGLLEIPVVIKDIPDEAAMAISLIENIQRENLNPLEEARALQRLIEEFALTHEQVAETIGKSRTVITNLLRLLTKLNPEVANMLENGVIEKGHALVLLTLDHETQLLAAKQILSRDLSVRATEQLIQRLLQESENKASEPPKIDEEIPSNPVIQAHIDQLSKHLATKVDFQHRSNGKGKLIIHYEDLEVLNKILKHIQQRDLLQNLA